MKILAIGGTGRLGSSFVVRALALQHTVTVVSRGIKPIPNGADAIIVDRNDEEAWRNAVMDGRVFDDGGEAPQPDNRYDYVIDFSGSGQMQATQMLGIDGWGKPNLFISSDFVYSARQERYPLTETGSRYQTRFFGGGKYQFEWMLNSGSSRRFTNVIRPGYIYSEQYVPGVLPPYIGRNMLDVIREEVVIELPASGFFLFQPLYQGDFVDTLIALLQRPDLKGCKWNLAGPELIDVRSFYLSIAAHLDMVPAFEFTPYEHYLAADEGGEQYFRNRYLDLSAFAATGLDLPGTVVREVLTDQSSRYRYGC